ncbi:hypothetical protein GCM10009821_24710 [Aeromicrobium halocynthiae]|uniref:G domain-containing protein n=1 Tax=Aeromicrobium halocynthiae TaxID=560557 RepID=A0ABN2W4A9_9ACTN
MSALTDAARKAYPGPRSEVSERLTGLGEAIEAGEGRLDDALVQPARDLAERAVQRLQLSGEHTIVALAGATGSGKSSLFNALTDLELAGVGVRRPTTSWALACAWGPDGASELLAWMGIPARHQVSRMSMLDTSSAETRLDGLVLLDLPDHDSTEVSHHVEMERLVEYSDLVVWVLDPQKYADAAIHDRYIKPMASYSDVMLVVLNQIDRIAYGERERALDDVRAILAREGLPDVPVLGVSAARGDGIDDLKRELQRRIKAKSSARDRLASDLDHIAQRIARSGGTSEVPGIGDVDRQALTDGLAEATGAPDLAQALESSLRRRVARTTAWPPLRLASRRRGDDPTAELAELSDETVPTVGALDRSRVDQVLGTFADTASVGLAAPWRSTVTEAVRGRADAVTDGLEGALRSLDAGPAEVPAAWRAVAALQWVGLVALVVGLGWSALALAPDVGGVAVPDGPQVAGLPASVLLAVLGAVAGVVLTLAGALGGRASARSRADRVEGTLRTAAAEVAAQHAVEPVRAELERYRRYRDGIVRATS